MHDKKNPRLHRATGEDLPGSTVLRRNFERRDTVGAQMGGSTQTGGAPSADPRVSGSKVSHTGLYGAPDVYTEKFQGRMGTKGKRK